jgi:hypothetical protein
LSASAAFVQFCREQGLVGGRVVAVDGTKMRAVASLKNIAGAERLARDIAYTEKEIAYYLNRLDIIDETVAQGFGDNHDSATGYAVQKQVHEGPLSGPDEASRAVGC